ncbi:hypothetical protein RB596_004963 [Gaeumannomyces avenae]
MKPATGLLISSAALGQAQGLAAPVLDCSAEALAGALPANATIESVAPVSAGGTYGEGSRNIAYPTQPEGLPDLCAVVVKVKSSDISSYRFGAFLPAGWNGRFLEVGNGGFSGGINWLDMGARVRAGFAVVSTDTGHSSTSGDVTWATNEEVKEDWGHRAIHGSAVAGKQLAKAYYGQAARFSYYAGCSTGGRQGLREAQLYPDTFDGILAGAPAWWTSHLQTWTLRQGALNLPADAPSHIPPQLFPVLAAEVRRQCDGADGVGDGIISQPDKCKLDLSTIRCPSDAAGSDCLTAAQIETASKSHADYVIDGTYAFSGLELGSEDIWAFLMGGSSPSTYGTQYVQYMLLNNPSWDWRDYNDTIVALADARNPGRATADGFDMSAYKKQGGKVIMYHGMSDALIATGSSTHFYKTVGAATPGSERFADWFRFFLVPGMGHCSGTSVDAPWYIGGASQQGSLSADVTQVPTLETGHDALLALMTWVERGTAPDKIVATSFGNSRAPNLQASRQRPLCPYPAVAAYDGRGDVNSAESWTCQ